MVTSPLVLVVDDDADLRSVVSFALQKAGFRTLEAENGQRALEAWRIHAPDIIVLDIMMPEMDGTEVCRHIRRTSDVPILFLSSRDDEIDRVLGLELGGDDYITKPFGPRELVARIKAVMRRLARRRLPEQNRPTPIPSALQHGHLRLDQDHFKVYWKELEIPLTVTEFGLLRTLLERPGRVFSRDELMQRAYKEQTIVSDRTIDSHITRIRRKFEQAGAHPIETVHGLGYKCNDCRA